MMRIVVIDDHPIVRSGVEMALNSQRDMNVIGTASNCQEGLDLIKEEKPDVAIVDLKMPGGGGLELIRKAKKIIPTCRYLILTSYAAQADVSESMTENVDGYVLKEALPEEFIKAIRLVFQGKKYYDAEIMNMLVTKIGFDPFDSLTPREIEVLSELAKGMNNTAIAQKLFISESTVKKHISNLLDKLDMQDRTQAALYGYSNGLGKMDDAR